MQPPQANIDIDIQCPNCLHICNTTTPDIGVDSSLNGQPTRNNSDCLSTPILTRQTNDPQDRVIGNSNFCCTQ